MIQIEYLPVVLTGIGIIASILYYASVLRNQNKTQQMQLQTRKTQIFMQIFERLNSEETAKSWAELINMEVPSYDEFLLKYDSSVNPAHYAKRVHIWYSFHAVGELLRMRTIEPDLVHRLQLSPMVIAMWEKWEHVIREIRLRENFPEYGEGFEYLYHELKRLRREKGYQEYSYPARKR